MPFFFNDTATTEIYTLSLHDALPISPPLAKAHPPGAARCPLRSLLHQLAGCLMGDSLPTPLPSSRRRSPHSSPNPSASSPTKPPISGHTTQAQGILT